MRQTSELNIKQCFYNLIVMASIILCICELSFADIITYFLERKEKVAVSSFCLGVDSFIV